MFSQSRSPSIWKRLAVPLLACSTLVVAGCGKLSLRGAPHLERAGCDPSRVRAPVRPAIHQRRWQVCLVGRSRAARRWLISPDGTRKMRDHLRSRAARDRRRGAACQPQHGLQAVGQERGRSDRGRSRWRATRRSRPRRRAPQGQRGRRWARACAASGTTSARSTVAMSRHVPESTFLQPDPGVAGEP
jgi:hypothetical protein